ncbi:hypothetical protein [Cellulomonas chengniuliangii]|uniref:Ceramidase n=1 Tax=Cellulomonas chengniuliangii TaxID=2968084 RepID=A0ABY5KVZ0_9CELL|nr:hypothetical protein [Cellulomonas chengniuliangii]MCC2309805.1 hypothetical protein [Cellulomonas chengniuliangii]MCC2319097.1 hypothetical protein [Cellulomonas chengniuliangii]UUI74652.1 hypothetical protein NP064_12765 [Cellulomonas chengniuliangii]
MAMLASALAQAASTRTGHACEEGAGFLHEPVSAVTSLAFVVAGGLVIIDGLRAARAGNSPPGAHPGTVAYAALVAGIGVGSVIQHGPDPAWSDVAHDLPLVATLAFVAADSAAALAGRRRAWWWWAAPSIALVPVMAAAPEAADAAQAGIATAAVALTLARACATPRLRRRITASMGVLGIGAAIGALTRAGGPWCVPESVWQGHGAWHVLAAAALVVLAPVIGDPGGPGPTGDQQGVEASPARWWPA